MREAGRRLFTELHYRAEAAGRSIIGSTANGVPAYAEVDRDGRRLYVCGQAFVLPPDDSDSALVIVVDRVDSVGGPPHVMGTAWIPARMPAEFWDRHWTSGDTTFSVRPPFGRRQRMLIDAIRRDPQLAVVLDEPGAMPWPKPSGVMFQRSGD